MESHIASTGHPNIGLIIGWNGLSETGVSSVGRKSESIATQLAILVLPVLPLPGRLLLVIDDSPTKRYGPKVEGADMQHNPTPGPAEQPFLYGQRPPLRGGAQVAISLALRHSQWGPLAFPLRAMLYVRQQTMATIPKSRKWQRFAMKLPLAARLVEWIVPLLKQAEKAVWIVIDESKIGFARSSTPSIIKAELSHCLKIPA